MNIPTSSQVVDGTLVGLRLRLKKELSLRGTDQVHAAGEIWQVDRVQAGSAQTIVLLRKPNGSPHIWTGGTIWQWFEIVSTEEPSSQKLRDDS